MGAPIEFLLVGAMAPPLLAIVDTSKLETLSPNDSPSTLNSTNGYDTITVSLVQIMGFCCYMTSRHPWMWFAQSLLIQETRWSTTLNSPNHKPATTKACMHLHHCDGCWMVVLVLIVTSLT